MTSTSIEMDTELAEPQSELSVQPPAKAEGTSTGNVRVSIPIGVCFGVGAVLSLVSIAVLITSISPSTPWMEVAFEISPTLYFDSELGCPDGHFTDINGACFPCLGAPLYDTETYGFDRCQNEEIAYPSFECSSQADCPIGSYCAASGNCDRCINCRHFNDAIDGDCPIVCRDPMAPVNAPPAIPYSNKPTSVAMELTLREARITVHQEPFTTPGGPANQIHLGVDLQVTKQFTYMDESPGAYVLTEDGIHAEHIELKNDHDATRLLVIFSIVLQCLGIAFVTRISKTGLGITDKIGWISAAVFAWTVSIVLLVPTFEMSSGALETTESILRSPPIVSIDPDATFGGASVYHVAPLVPLDIVKDVSVGRADHLTIVSSTGVSLVVAALVSNALAVVCVCLVWFTLFSVMNGKEEKSEE